MAGIVDYVVLGVTGIVLAVAAKYGPSYYRKWRTPGNDVMALHQKTSDFFQIKKVVLDEGGNITIAKESWNLKAAKPKLIETGVGTKPFYWVASGESSPKTFSDNSEESQISPKVYRAIIKSDLMAKALSLTGDGNMMTMLIYIAIGVVIGYLAGNVIPMQGGKAG